ncbi:MAG: hypothetical protein JJT89_18330 [Nitriliruptoraceae bacterium]|nr:hypothetical protein [Nitriliruptoraceae bacterium]
MSELPADDGHQLDPADAALAAVVQDAAADLDLDALAALVEAPRTLLEAIERAGLLVPDHHDADGTARYGPAEADALRAGMTLLDAGLPLGELLDLARRTDEAITAVADAAVEAFLRFVRDPVRGGAADESLAAERLVTAYDRMLPATEQLVAHHLRRRLLVAARDRILAERGVAASTPDTDTDTDAATDTPTDPAAPNDR